MKRTIIWVLTLLMILCLTTTAFASDKLVINQNNVQEVLAEAEKGDKLAIEALQKLAIFDEEKVDKALKGVTFSSLDGPKTISFDDGSSIEVTVNLDKSIRGFEYLYSGSATYNWKLFGITIVSYTIYADYWIDDGYDTVRLDDHWDDSWAVPPYIDFHNGTRAITTSGTYVKVRGEGGFESNGGIAGSRTEEFEFKGYANQTCTITII
jgi:hypothetical protein